MFKKCVAGQLHSAMTLMNQRRCCAIVDVVLKEIIKIQFGGSVRVEFGNVCVVR